MPVLGLVDGTCGLNPLKQNKERPSLFGCPFKVNCLHTRQSVRPRLDSRVFRVGGELEQLGHADPEVPAGRGLGEPSVWASLKKNGNK